MFRGIKNKELKDKFIEMPIKELANLKLYKPIVIEKGRARLR